MTPATAPLISVVVPLYDKAAYVERLVACLRAQVFGDFEVIIVDDGSRDDGVERVERLTRGDPRFTLLRRVNGGVSVARNDGIARARSAWIAFLDADDEWHPDYLAEMAGAIRRWPEAAMISTAHETRSPGCPPTTNEGLLRGHEPIDAAGFFDAWLRVGERPVFIGATAIRRDCLERCGGFEPGMALGEELLTFIRVLEFGQLVFVDRILAYYHLSAAGSLATSPSVDAVRGHERLIEALLDQVRRGRCPKAVLAKQARIHVYHQMQNGMRREMWASLWRMPTLWPLPFWLMALLESARLRVPVKRLIARLAPG
ncbi:MAG: glycosyltransferase [Burkholderiaceae bacterium]